MKCKVNAGALREALQIALITVDKRAGSELGYISFSAKSGKNGKNQRMLLNSTDSISKTLIRIDADVEEPGDLIVEPIRISALLDRRAAEDVAIFSQASKTSRIDVKVGNARSWLSNAAARASTYDLGTDAFPYAAAPLFVIEADNLRMLLDRTESFVYKKDGFDGYKNVLIRAIPGGYEAMASNKEVVAKARIEDKNAPAAEDGQTAPQIEVPGRGLPSVMRMLARNKKELIRVIVTSTPGGDPCQVFFRTDDIFLGTRLSAAKLPPVDIIFKHQDMGTSIDVPREKLLDSIHRSDPFCSESTSGRLISLEVKGSAVKLVAEDPFGNFEEFVESAAPAVGERKATFHVGYLSEVLRTTSEDVVTLKLGTSGPNKKPAALVLAGNGNGASYVVGAIG